MWRWWCGVAVALVVAGCARRGPPPVEPPAAREGWEQVGVASWYGPGFHGRRTASGETFDQHDTTAAHRTLPHGTRVLVTNLQNARTVEVRINDRGPFVGDRIIDLSYAAARTIGMIGPGTARVRLGLPAGSPPPAPAPRRAESPPATVPPPAEPPPALLAAEHPAPPTRPAAALPPAPGRVHASAPAAPPSAEPGFVVHIATLSDAARAAHLRDVIARRFPEAFVAPLDGPDRRYYRVRVGPYARRAGAEAHGASISRLGYPAVVLEQEGR